MTAKTYLGDIIGGSIMLRESRLIAQLLLQHPDDEAWERAVVEENLLQKSRFTVQNVWPPQYESGWCHV